MQVEVRPLRLAADWQPMLRPTRHRESFFFNPDAGRNAPTLPPEWGRGPGMAAVDPLVPFDPEAPLLQVQVFVNNVPSHATLPASLKQDDLQKRKQAVCGRRCPEGQAGAAGPAPKIQRSVSLTFVEPRIDSRNCLHDTCLQCLPITRSGGSAGGFVREPVARPQTRSVLSNLLFAQRRRRWSAILCRATKDAGHSKSFSSRYFVNVLRLHCVSTQVIHKFHHIHVGGTAGGRLREPVQGYGQGGGPAACALHCSRHPPLGPCARSALHLFIFETKEACLSHFRYFF